MPPISAVSAHEFRLLGLRDDVPALLAAADVFLLPTDGTEGWPPAWSRALATGTPAVVTDVPGPALVDATPFPHDGRWYLLVETTGAQNDDELCLYHADDLAGRVGGAPAHAGSSG